jgi:hypothetical protein
MEKKRKKKTGGRRPGSLNKRTLLGKGITEVFRNMLGFDDAAVERTGIINGKGVLARERIIDTLHGRRPATNAEHRALVSIMLPYAYGLPNKMPLEGGRTSTLNFTMVHGYAAWDPRVDPLRERAAAMVKAKEEREQMLALERGKRDAIEVQGEAVEDEGETLESVSAPESPDAFLTRERRTDDG